MKKKLTVFTILALIAMVTFAGLVAEAEIKVKKVDEAVQNLNLMQGWDETEGLLLTPSYL